MNAHPLSRRDFIERGAAAVMLAAAGRSTSAAAVPSAPRVLGAVTGAIKKQLEEDWLGTLQRVAEIGFKELEFSDPLGPSDAEARKALDALGLRAVAGGGPFRELRARLPGMSEQWKTQGKNYLACYWPWLDNGKGKTLDDYRALAAAFNEFGKTTKAAGLRFVFHHHALEFIPTEGRVPFDLLLAETDPELVSVELDVYWLATAGADPVAYLEKYPARFPILHLGDVSKSGDGTIVCPGEGTLDFRPALAAATQAGVSHVFIENPAATTGLACLEGAYTHVRGLPF